MRVKTTDRALKYGIMARAAEQYMKTAPLALAQSGDEVIFEGPIVDSDTQAFLAEFGIPSVSSTSLRESLGEPREISLVVNSPGGDAAELAGLIGVIRGFRQNGGVIRARVAGIAASAATVVTSIVNSVSMEALAVFMVHSPTGGSYGSARSLRSFADFLLQTEDTMIKIYTAKTRKPEDDVRQAVIDETFYSAEEALSFGFIDKVEPVPEPEADSNQPAEEQTAVAALSPKHIILARQLWSR